MPTIQATTGREAQVLRRFFNVIAYFDNRFQLLCGHGRQTTRVMCSWQLLHLCLQREWRRRSFSPQFRPPTASLLFNRCSDSPLNGGSYLMDERLGRILAGGRMDSSLQDGSTALKQRVILSVFRPSQNCCASWRIARVRADVVVPCCLGTMAIRPGR